MGEEPKYEGSMLSGCMEFSEPMKDAIHAATVRSNEHCYDLSNAKGDTLEAVARAIAAVRMGLVNDVKGARLPDHLWGQSIPHARAAIEAMRATERKT